MANHQIVPVSRIRKLKKLELENGFEYSLIRNNQIQVGQEARDFLKEFSTYVGQDGVQSKSAVVKDKKTGEKKAKASGGAVHVGVTTQFNRLLGGGVVEADKSGDMELVFKHGLSWCKVRPILSEGMERNAPRKECFRALWAKVEEIGRL